MTKDGFLQAYRKELTARYTWSTDQEKLARFMSAAKAVLDGTPTLNLPWNHHGPAVIAAWRAIGGKGNPTLKALRALPKC